MVVSFDTSLLVNYYAAKLPLPASQIAASPSQTQQSQQKATPPWDISIAKPAQQLEDVASRSSDPYFDPKDATLKASANGTSTPNVQSEIAALLNSTLSRSSSSGNSTSSTNVALSADNDKMFALYSALNRLDYIAQMATRDGTVAGQLPGLDASFQNGLSQIQSFIKNTSFSNLSVLPGETTSAAQSSVTIPYPVSDYQGGAVVGDKPVSYTHLTLPTNREV